VPSSIAFFVSCSFFIWFTKSEPEKSSSGKVVVVVLTVVVVALLCAQTAPDEV